MESVRFDLGDFRIIKCSSKALDTFTNESTYRCYSVCVTRNTNIELLLGRVRRDIFGRNILRKFSTGNFIFVEYPSNKHLSILT